MVHAVGFLESVVDSLNRIPVTYAEIYDTSYSGGVTHKFQGTLKNKHLSKTFKEVIVTIHTFDCDSNCNNCTLVNEVNKKILNPDYDVFDTENAFSSFLPPKNLYPGNSFRFNIKFDDVTKYGSFVQKRGNVTCYSNSVKRVIGLGALQKALDY